MYRNYNSQKQTPKFINNLFSWIFLSSKHLFIARTVGAAAYAERPGICRRKVVLCKSCHIKDLFCCLFNEGVIHFKQLGLSLYLGNIIYFRKETCSAATISSVSASTFAVW